MTFFGEFSNFLPFLLNISKKWTMVVILRFFRFFWQPCCRMLERLFWLYQCSRNTCNCYRFILRSTSLWCELHLWNFKFLCLKLVRVLHKDRLNGKCSCNFQNHLSDGTQKKETLPIFIST